MLYIIRFASERIRCRYSIRGLPLKNKGGNNEAHTVYDARFGGMIIWESAQTSSCPTSTDLKR